MSYYSAEWIPVSELEKDKNQRVRVRRFLEKPNWDTQWSEDEPFNPSYVKWAALPYDCSTWEEAELVEKLDGDKIDDFSNSKSVDQDKVKSYTSLGRKSPNGRWKKLPESPKFNDGYTLRTYQLEGLNWLMYCWYNKQNSILADEMGLGKTVQSTAFLFQLYRQENIKGPFLVIVPLSTMGNWEREIKTWTTMNVIVYHGNQTSRNLIVETEFYYRDSANSMIPGAFKFDVLLTTYEMAMSGAAHLRPIPWRVAVLDEAHRLKNKSSKVTEYLKSYQMEHRVLLTGTPLQNSLDELWALLNFLEPDTFASEKDFQKNFGSMNSANDVERLQLLLKPLMLRRLKEDVEKSIPVKEETVVEVELTTTQKKWYRSILEKNFTWLKQGGKKNIPNMVNTMIELRKCCIHPWLLNGAEEQILEELNCHDSHDLQIKALINSSGKMVLIDKLLKKLKLGGHKVLIFSQMTKCLDLIQEYLRAQKWQFERIDGGVRGEYRQAAIDRFSEEGSECFVFLLCTRAGGVGINLTAADTCIIFDSDWNPQNDLQAQSRCHRIGQKKLITRNTYEREMFDRASMKLGLDKAVLQRNAAGNDPFDSKSKNSSLSKQEVEELLKKGAYGAFMDDGAGDKFCEEDIEQILERRTMVIRHDGDSENRKGSMFSKASFQADNSSASVDVNDPDFWDKVAEQAQFEINEDTWMEDPLILDVPRNRKQVARYDGKDVDSDSGSEYKVKFKPADAKMWTTTERSKLERLIMQHGFFHWDKMQESFPKRTAEHLKACTRALTLRCLETCTTLEKDIQNDVKRALAIFYPYNPTFTDGDAPIEDYNQNLDTEEPSVLDIPDDELPWVGSDEKEKFEYSTFLKEASPDYLEHLDKKAKNLLIRIALMYNIRHRNSPNPELFVPKILGAPPAAWWGPEQDRDLLIGICKHGYQQYSKIWTDSELCFYDIFQAAAVNNTDAAVKKPEENDNDNENDADSDANVLDQDDELDGEDEDEEPKNSNEDAPDASAQENAPKAENSDFHIPTPTELGVRVRRILAALAKYRITLVREKEKEEILNERNRVREEKRVEKLRHRENEFSKKHKQDFQRTLLSYGVKKLPDCDKYDWTKFKVLADLQKKSDDAMDAYLKKLIAMSTEIVANHEKDSAAKKRTAEAAEDDTAAVVAPSNDENGIQETAPESVLETTAEPTATEDGETLTFDRAKKVLRRISFFEKLRSQLQTPELVSSPLKQLAEKLSSVKRHGKTGLPKWWDYSYDIPFLIGVERYGITRGDLFIEADDLPFKQIQNEFLKSLEERKKLNIGPSELVFDKFEEKFWMRDAVALKRFELLVNLAEKPVKVKKTKVSKLKSDVRGASEPASDDAYSDIVPPPVKKVKVASNADEFMQNEPVAKLFPLVPVSAKKPEAANSSDVSSGDDTDEMLEQAAKCLVYSKKKKHKKLQEFPPGIPIVPMSESMVAEEMMRLYSNTQKEVEMFSSDLKRSSSEDNAGMLKKIKVEELPPSAIINSMLAVCQDKCYSQPEGYLNKGEALCVDRCVEKFFKVAKLFEEKTQKKMDEMQSLYEQTTGTEETKRHTNKVTCLSFYKTEKEEYLVSGSADKSVIVWGQQGSRWVQLHVLKGHESGVVAVGVPTVESENFIITTADSTNKIKVWEKNEQVITNSETIDLSPHHSMSLAIHYLPGTTTPIIFSGGTNMKVQVFIRKESRFENVLSITGHADWIRSIKVARFTNTHGAENFGFNEGDLMVASASQDKYIRIWRVSRVVSGANDKENSNLTSEMIDAMNEMNLNEGDSQLSTKAYMIEVPNSNKVNKYTFMLDAILMGHDDWAFSLNWETPIIKELNGKRVLHQPMSIVSASADKTLILWTPDKHSDTWVPMNRLGEIGGSTLGFYGAKFSNDGKKLFSNGYGGSIHIWDYSESGTLPWNPAVGISGHFQSVEDCSWDPTGSFLLTTSLDQTSRVFAPWNQDSTTWHEIARTQIHGYNLHCLAFTGKYQYVSGADEKVLRVFDAPKTFAQTLESLTKVKESEEILNERPIGANLPALGLSNKAVFAGEAPQASTDVRLSAYTAEVISSTLATHLTQPPFEEHLLQHTLWPEMEKLYGHVFEIISVAASRDGSLVASASKATKAEHAGVRLWSTKTWTEVGQPLAFHSLTVTTIRFTNCSKYVLTAGRDRGWALFDISAAQSGGAWKLVQAEAKAHSRIIWASCFSHDDKLFATGSRDKSLKIWSKIGEKWVAIETLKFDESVTAVDFYHSLVHSNYKVAVGLENGNIKVIDIAFDGAKITAKDTFDLPIDAAFQVEGAVDADGKSKSIWDTFAHLPGKIFNNDSPDVADDEYHLYAETVNLLKAAGANSYRFSISWPRLVPGGSAGSPINPLAVDHYNKIINLLVENNITPLVTLYHWDLPQSLEDAYGGLLNADKLSVDFAYYADAAFAAFGDRVKHWLTFNEPTSSCVLGYATGEHAPGHCTDRTKCAKGNGLLDVVQCMHSILVSHGEAVKVFRQKYQPTQKGMISIAPNVEYAVPLDPNSAVDKFFTGLKLDLTFNWWFEAAFNGYYPKAISNFLGPLMPQLNDYLKNLLKGSVDFVAINHYTSCYVTAPWASVPTDPSNPFNSIPLWKQLYQKNGQPIGAHAESPWLYDVPWGFGELLKYAQTKYNDPLIIVTENGWSVKGENQMALTDAVSDLSRVQYYKGYIDSMNQVMEENKVKVIGYFGWALLDNFEWATGYSNRFGITHVDFATQNRTLKASAYYLANYFTNANYI
ncbi:choline dehydrogenase 7 [Terramyces sp. JEL0728]|nr:choline dehydrogenase 7 [Terramyces sp. JEL0728]